MNLQEIIAKIENKGLWWNIGLSTGRCYYQAKVSNHADFPNAYTGKAFTLKEVYENNVAVALENAYRDYLTKDTK